MRRRAEGDEDTVVAITGDFNSGKLRTRFANEAIDLAEVFKMLIGSSPLRGPVRFGVELSAPDGPSTGGGVQSVQHIKLVPEDGGATVVAGWVDQNAGRCELRMLDYLEAQHHQRFVRSTLKAPPGPAARLDRKHYDGLLERMRAFFVERDVVVSVLERPEQPTVIKAEAPQRPVSAAPSHVFFIVVVGALLGLTVAAISYLLVRR